MEHTLVGQKWQTPLLLQKLRQPSQNKSVNGTGRFSAQGYMQLVSCGLATFLCLSHMALPLKCPTQT